MGLRTAHYRMGQIGPEYLQVWQKFDSEGQPRYDLIEVWADWAVILLKHYAEGTREEFGKLRGLIEELIIYGDEETATVATTYFLEAVIHRMERRAPKEERLRLYSLFGPRAREFIKAYRSHL